MHKHTVLLILSFLLLGSLSAQAQFQLRTQAKNLEGQALDSAELLLIPDNSEELIQDFSDATGQFDVANIPEGVYQLRLMYLGKLYWEQKLDVFADIDLGVLTVNTADQLDEIVIQGKPKIFENQVDRQVFHVANSSLASSGDALDAIKATPGLLVTQDDIKIAGKSSVLVMINNKLVRMSGSDLNEYLKTLPADQIQRIEVLNHPPAQYEAEGNSGLVNIVLKSSRENSWNNALRSTYNQGAYDNYRLGNTFTYSKNAWTTQASLDRGFGNTRTRESSILTYPDELWDNVDIGKTYLNYTSTRFEVDYKINSKNSSGFQYSGSFSNNVNRNTATTFVTQRDGQLLSEINTLGENTPKNQNQNFGWYFNREIDTTGRKITANLDYFTTKKNQDRPFESIQSFTHSNGDPVSLRAINTSAQNMQIYSAKIDVEYPTSWAKWSYGTKVNWIYNRSKADYFGEVDRQLILDPTKSDDYQYKENTQALYLSGTKEWNSKWTTQLGLRLEATQTTGLSNSIGQTTKRSYFNIFPTFYTTYKPNEDNSWNINYSKRISRPGFWALNPFRWYIDSYSYTVGNPFLESYNTHSGSLTHSYKNTWTTELGYSKSTNSYEQYLHIDEESKTRIYSMENYYDLSEAKLTETFVFAKFHWWQSTNLVQLSYTWSSYKKPQFDYYQLQNGANFYVSSNNSFKVNPKLSLELNASYSPRSYYLYYEINPVVNLDVGLNYKLLDGKLQLSAFVFDLFRNSGFRATMESEQVTTRYHNYYDNQFARVGLKYNFGNANLKSKSINRGNEEERNRT